MKLDLVNLRYRAASKQALCTGHHEIHRSDDGLTISATCNGKELNALMVPKRGGDYQQDVQLFLHMAMAEHEQEVAAAIVLELLNRVESVGGYDSAYNRCEHGYMPLCPVSAHGSAMSSIAEPGKTG